MSGEVVWDNVWVDNAAYKYHRQFGELALFLIQGKVSVL